jgi:parallel beta-helix repeat protein
MHLPASLTVALAFSSVLAVLSPAQSSRPVVEAAPFLDAKLADCGFQKAIDLAANKAGGAIVKLPEGTFALRRGLVLKTGVELVGAGIDKTILTPARKPFALPVTSATYEEGTKKLTLGLDKVPDGIEAGLGTMLTPTMPPGHIVYTRPGVVVSVDKAANTVVVETPYGQRTATGAGKAVGLMTGGLEFFPEKEIKKGDTEIVLRNAKGILPGDELAIGEPPNESMLNMVFVKEVRGNTLVLEQPARADFAPWPPKEKFGNSYNSVLIWAVFPMVHGANMKDAAIRDLTVRGSANPDAVPLMDRYTVGGIHLYGTKDVTLERVAVRDWHTDGVSLQVAENDVIRDCVATGNKGNGFHPGTGAKALLFEGNLSTNNTEGLYFCWSNEGQTLRNNRFVGNKGPGIGGLGNPHDQRNTIEKNLIADNGGPGIEINGGMKSGNVIRDNVIENNSRSVPGKFPGIAIYASAEDALDYTITGNTIRDTQKEHTQLIGIEEKTFGKKEKPTRADENVIKGNQFSGHETADIVLVGEKTVVEGNGNAKVVKGPLETEAGAKK